MRLLILVAFLLVAMAATDATASDPQKSDMVDKAKEYIDAMKVLSKLINKGFDTIKSITSGLPGFLGMISKILGIINIFFGLPSSDAQQLKEYFDEVNRQFEMVFIQMDEVKRLISWESARGKFAEDEKQIVLMRTYYKRYISQPDNADIRNQFLTAYEQRILATTHLYNGVMLSDGVLLDNLAEAAMTFTKNDRRLTTDFLLGLLKLILQGSQMDILYYRLKGLNAELRQAQWDEKLKTLINKIDSTDAHLVNVWFDQANKDVDEIMIKDGGLGEAEIAGTMYSKLKQKFYWKKWCVISTRQEDIMSYIFERRLGWNAHHWLKIGSGKRVEVTVSDPVHLNMDAIRGAIGHTKAQAYTTVIPANEMQRHFRDSLRAWGQYERTYSYAVRAACAGCRLYVAGDPGQHHSENFVSFWLLMLIIPAAVDGNIAAC